LIYGDGVCAEASFRITKAEGRKKDRDGTWTRRKDEFERKTTRKGGYQDKLFLKSVGAIDIICTYRSDARQGMEDDDERAAEMQIPCGDA